jgi:hypothetical protein
MEGYLSAKSVQTCAISSGCLVRRGDSEGKTEDESERERERVLNEMMVEN